MVLHPNAPTDVPVQPLPLSPPQRAWLEHAVGLIDEEHMRAFDRTLTSMHSPTGAERAINAWMTQHMRDMGLEARYQPLDETSGNAIGQLRGSGGGPSLLLYAPTLLLDSGVVEFEDVVY